MKKSFLKFFFGTSFLLLFMLIGSGCLRTGNLYGEQKDVEGDGQVESQEPVTIGAIMPLTGDGASYGIPLQTVTEIAVEKINKEGGINGRTLDVIWEDGKCNGKDAASAAQKLISVDKVQVIFGGLCSSETLGIAPVAEAAGVLVLSTASSSPDITNAGDYIFRTYPSDSAQGSLLAQAAYDLGLKRTGMLVEENDYTLGISKVFKTSFESLGGTVIEETFLANDTDFRTQILKLLGEGVDMLFINPQTPPKADLIFKQLQEQDLSKVRLFSNDVVLGSHEILAQYQNLVEGMIGAEPSYEASNPEFIWLVEEYKTRTGKTEIDFATYSATTYDGVNLLAEGISKVGYNANALQAFLYDVKDWPGVSGKLTIDANGDPLAGHRVEILRAAKPVIYDGSADAVVSDTASGMPVPSDSDSKDTPAEETVVNEETTENVTDAAMPAE